MTSFLDCPLDMAIVNYTPFFSNNALYDVNHVLCDDPCDNRATYYITNNHVTNAFIIFDLGVISEVTAIQLRGSHHGNVSSR